jgi:hypothetical protein
MREGRTVARAIRYASSAAAAEHGPTTTSVRGETKDLDVDGYLERLAKYVPGEILAGFTPLGRSMPRSPAWSSPWVR